LPLSTINKTFYSRPAWEKWINPAKIDRRANKGDYVGLFYKNRDTEVIDAVNLEQELMYTQERGDFYLRTISSLFSYIKAFSFDLIDIEAHFFKYKVDEVNNLYQNNKEVNRI
jgi:hypothetical protein